jgi:hypothetical protein
VSELKVPPLEFRNPDCPLCDAELTSEAGEGWDCHDCGIWWTMDGDRAERIDDTIPQCPFTYAPGDHYRCVRDKDHPGLCAGVPADGSGSTVANWPKPAY